MVYESPLGRIFMASDGIGLTDLWFEGNAGMPQRLLGQKEPDPVIEETVRWLDVYFSGKEPDFRPILHMAGSDFDFAVWNLLLEIGYGKTVTYGDIAWELELLTDKRQSAQAIGGAVGRNPVALIVPCHRVVGAKGNLTGYGGGMDRKIALLKLEHGWQEGFHVPKQLPERMRGKCVPGEFVSGGS